MIWALHHSSYAVVHVQCNEDVPPPPPPESVLISVTVFGLGGQEIKSLDLSHLRIFSMGFSLVGPSPRVLKITGEKHAGNL